MLGGNAEYLATADLRRKGYEDEVVAEATGFADTDNEEILEARKLFAEKMAEYKGKISEEAEQVRQVGGLYILGTERHEARRIDNQLRGRSGRQGDPGESRFFLSLEDDILRLFGSERISRLMDTLNIDEDTPIDAKMLSGAIENAQKKVESRNFQIRKSVLDYDDVMNTQREVIYGERRKVLDGEDLKPYIETMIDRMIDQAILGIAGERGHISAEDLAAATQDYRGVFLLPDEIVYTDDELKTMIPAEISDKIKERAHDIYRKKEQILGEPLMRELERVMFLRVVDEYWMEHIDAMDDLKQGIRLQAYGQEDPVKAYKREGANMFDEMNTAIQHEAVRRIYVARVQTNKVERKAVAKVTGESAGGEAKEKPRRAPIRKAKKIGPNDPCPCGSGKKYKKCCGRDRGME